MLEAADREAFRVQFVGLVAERPKTPRQLAKKEGILAGISAGGNVWAALEVAKRPGSKGKTIVTVICDTGERYLSTWLFQEYAG